MRHNFPACAKILLLLPVALEKPPDLPGLSPRIPGDFSFGIRAVLICRAVIEERKTYSAGLQPVLLLP